MNSDAGSDATMLTAQSQVPPLSRPLSRATYVKTPEPSYASPDRPSSPMPVEEPVVTQPSLDLMHRIPGLYRLLDLVQERGSGGVVDKIIIAQDSIKAFANMVRPGSYRSEIQVDFKGLDKHTIRPRGIYGSASAIIDFLDSVGCMTPEARGWMLRNRDEYSGISCPTLRPGLYLVNPVEDDTGRTYIVFWPEDGTWNDGAISSVSRNRVTFMRYLTKLCDQTDCLISDEHADQLVWKDDPAQINAKNDEYRSFGDRMFGYMVQRTNEEEESAQAEDGFHIRHRAIEPAGEAPHGYPTALPFTLLQPQMIVGDTSQCLMQTRYIPEEVTVIQIDRDYKTLALEELLSISHSPYIIIDKRIDRSGLRIVLDHGLWTRCGDLRKEWDARIAREAKKRDDDKYSEMRKKKDTAGAKSLKRGMIFWLGKQASMTYSIIPEHKLFQAIMPPNTDLEAGECETSIAEVATWLDQHPELRQKVTKDAKGEMKSLDPNPTVRYNMLKRQLLQVLEILGRKDLHLSDEDIQRLADLVQAQKEDEFKSGVGRILNSGKRTSSRNPFKMMWELVPPIPLWGSGTTVDTQKKTQNVTNSPPLQEDPLFSKFLERLMVEAPHFQPAIEEFKLQITELLRHKIRKLSESTLKTLETGLKDAADNDIRSRFEERREREEGKAWTYLKEKVDQCLMNSTPKRNNGIKLTITSVTRENIRQTRAPDTFHVKGQSSSPNNAGLEYILFPFQVTQDDMTAISNDHRHICKPGVRPHHAQAISVPLNTTIRFIQLLENDLAFVIVQEPQVLLVYLETLDLLASTILNKKVIKTFHSVKLGSNPLFALDATRRLLVIFATTGLSIHLNVYSFDSNSRSLTARGSPINLTRWYNKVPEVIHFLFVNGTEELLLVEKGGVSRIFSLVTANFRPSSLRLAGDPEAAYSSADGACLILKTVVNDKPHILCYHWASFGSNEGTKIPWPNETSIDSQMVVSSVGTRQSTHIILLDRRQGFCKSLRVQITSKSSEFAFRSNLNNNGRSGDSINTTHNSLIDCHAEVWTRFPVNAAIVKETIATADHRPRAILFVSTSASNPFTSYFDNMVRDFEYKTRKPTRNQLRQIVIRADRNWHSASPGIPTSEFQAGDWLVGLFCLIPIHLAITRSNRFVPLKDGVDSPEFEHTLLGANVAQISEALSFGWYESIFSSYLANKPVKVVTSMGEQSVGKSFALNHFVDTSFAGSAMRCTEGVWLSVTPTREYLVVAMDFEGVHSIERSAQEDTLLVLLNSAISNLVLFRNNFALSRDITGLFNSFQSCSKVLDPASNPSLFRSTLGIIIKDVIDSDTREIVNEFQQKFQRIVQKEKEENFITKLHGGRLDIIPWPVIESTRFYDLFGGLKLRLDDQPITHPHAGAFLGALKMLMAKLKANDWGALDQNLAAQRAQLLNSLLPTALAFGTTDPVNDEQLKNYDTDELIPNNDTLAVYFVEDVLHPNDGPLSLDSCLVQLRLGWQHRQDRYTMAEQEFLTGYNQYLAALTEARIGHVQAWIDANSSRFGEKAEVTALRRTFDQLSKDLRMSTVLCGSKCSNCGLLCLEHKQHDGDHNCLTDHKCPELCGFTDQHEEGIGCDLPAGHIGRHVCSGTPHLCGVTCQMYGRNGCLTACTKPMDHDEDEGHLCAASMHTCGELCSLVKEDGNRLCVRTCTLDCRIPHELHTCDRSLSCPIKCQLCKSYCAVGDHFHALQPDAVHLCGQKHDCKYKCELDGVCEINTTPQSIESTFVGRHTTFTYTKYTQEARRLQCIISLAPDQLEHEGRHVHSSDCDPFHYCEERCKHCGYYCTLPLGHVQSEHSTNHGSMGQTEWIVEGDDDATLEVQGHKYATGDSGAPMLCSLLCETLGRHVHVDDCRPEGGKCVGAELKHIVHPKENLDKDWVTHRLFWARSGFKDPYSQEKQDEFGLCDHRCGGQEHDGDENSGAAPSYCTLPLFHGLPDPDDVPPLGHISHDGHAYKCKNPALMQRSFHIFFVLDHSGSMMARDRRPLPDSPATQRIVQRADNRFGAVISSLYAFWTAREAAISAGANSGQRRDAYSIISFHHNASVTLNNDTVSDPDQLVDLILGDANSYGGTNYTVALEAVQKLMEDTWMTERSPVVIFLSDGECGVQDATIYDLCRSAARLGKALAFNSVSFGQVGRSYYLRRMATIAKEVYDTVPPDPLAPAGVNPCTFSSALDTVQLASTFLSLAESLKNPRAALSRV